MSDLVTVPQLERPTRLDHFLVGKLGPGWSRSAIQRATKQGGVLVNGKRVPVHHFLKTGEVITLPESAPPRAPQLAPNADVSYRLVSETPQYLIIDKPTGLVVHPAPGVHEPTLVDGLLARYPELTSVGEDPIRPGIVHRLDREVSGLMVVARTQDAYQHLKQQFQERAVQKTYTALVIGRVLNPSGTINFPLARSRRQHGKIAARASGDEDTREAITHYTVKKTYQQATLLSVTLETGRTHQIRAHLAALGYPIVGDTLYRPATLSFKATPSRIFLHAGTLAFTDPVGQLQTFTSPLPKKLQDFLDSLS
ncbi:MAG: RluA family pseudouridine synthase [Candidatus Veblenbacteria bacterium]|nr:RluA family pseudouridine synthase [Candidatus Veblenbacteria bacterium]MDZ4229939.1 RluA family pseudouridine synthase [Candidatus Veblenbacteria bacterium]